MKKYDTHPAALGQIDDLVFKEGQVFAKLMIESFLVQNEYDVYFEGLSGVFQALVPVLLHPTRRVYHHSGTRHCNRKSSIEGGEYRQFDAGIGLR